jgi:hypothetical protein
VIRRAFWLSMGAAAGIAGYRRVSAVGRAVQVRVAGERAGSAAGPFWPAQAIEPGSAPMTASHAKRPVPESTAARRAPGSPSRSATRAAWRTSRAAWRAQKATVSGVRSAGRFARDVREGMDAYMSRQDS